MRHIRIIPLLLFAATAFAYEQPLHRRITGSALTLVSQNNDFLSRLGISQSSQFGIGGSTPAMLMSEGADREDDGFRPLNHFLNPVSGEPLTVPPYVCFAAGQRADDWAIDGFLNDWSLNDARSWLRTAVVGPTPEQRDLGYRMLFATLGHAVHLVQDMAQPEHTRNDQHRFGAALPTGKCTPGSLYEYWTLHHLSGLYPSETIAGYDNLFVGFQVISLPSYEAYFRTAGGHGLANLTNSNFVTQDTNYGDEAEWWALTGRCATFDHPRLADATARVEAVTETVLNDPLVAGPHEIVVPEIVYSSNVNDVTKGISVTDMYHTHYSSIDHEIQLLSQSDPLNGGEGIYSLSNHSYFSRAAILLPRAVEYSAGLVDRFFRGRVSVTWSQNSDDTYNATIRNDSAERIGPEARFTAFYKATPAYFNRITTEDTQVIFDDLIAAYQIGFQGLAPGESVTLSHIFVPGLQPGDSLLQFERRVAIIGSLGDEPQVIIPAVQAPAGLRIRVDATPNLVTAMLHCTVPPPTYVSDTPVPIGVEKPFTIQQTCRAVITHVEHASIGFEGTPTTIRLRVWRGTQIVEDVSAVIDASDRAVGGCHAVSTDGHCDRFITRIGGCVYDPDYLNDTKCFGTTERWDWGTGPY